MFRSCRPKACNFVCRSGHSLDLDVEDPQRYEAPPESPLWLTRPGLKAEAAAQGRPRAATDGPRATGGGFFTACTKPKVGGGDEIVVVPPRSPRALVAAAAPPPVPPPAEVADGAPLDAGYALMEDSDEEDEYLLRAQTFMRRFSEVNRTVSVLQVTVGVLLVVAALLTVCLCLVAYEDLRPEHQAEARNFTLLASIPIVACLFTWFHIWMAIQMMFRPLAFIGCYNHKGTGMGLGWQGVVPRKASRMASMGYVCARPYIQGPREIMDAVDPRALVTKTRPELVQVIEKALSKVGAEHYPWIDRQLGASGKRRIAEASVDRIIERCPELWKEYTELLSDTKVGIDNDGMFVKVFTENKDLLNSFFLSLGEKEFRFIEHCGAVMGFICGLVQLIAFNNLQGVTRVVFLPATGFFLGIFSNWLAIQMVFKPTYPIPVRIFGFHIYDIQGLFLKRQMDVCALYSKMVVQNFLNFDKIVEYMMSQDTLWAKLKVSYLAFNTKVMKESMGAIATWLAPLTFGTENFAQVEEGMRMALVDGLYEAKAIHKIAGKYVGKVTNLERKNCIALQRMPPDEFENLLHPIFKEDEWILVLLGGVLGVIVGIAQIYFLSD